MSEETAKFAPLFKRWADGFATDARLFLTVLSDDSQPRDVRILAGSGLQYMLMQMDVIPDHLPLLGVLDDAFVLRVAAALMIEQDAAGLPTDIGRLANDDERVREFLGQDQYEILKKLVQSLATRETRKRTVQALVDSPAERKHFEREIRAQLEGPAPATIDDPAKLERDVLSYFRSKLVRL